MKKLNYPNDDTKSFPEEQVKVTIEHLYDCMTSPVYDDHGRQLNVTETFNETWESLFDEPNRFKMEE